MAIKDVDDVLFCGHSSTMNKYVQEIQAKYELGTVVYGPGSFLFYGLQINQDENFDVQVNGDD